MNPVYKISLKSLSFSLLIVLSSSLQVNAQACGSAQGDQTTYGTNNVWIGYAYSGQNFDNYQGYVNEGATSSPNFDESFGGAQVNYPTNGCSVYTEGFSVRYKLQQSFTGNYTITVGGDDGYRLSIDGGSTWVINNWNDHGYTTTSATVNLSGTTSFVLEYYENGGDNRVTFNMTQNCSGTGDPTLYGSGNTWNGFLYQGMNFETYKGSVTEGSAVGSNFDENFGNPGGSNTNIYNTSSCYVQTYQFSARYRLTQNLAAGTYVFTVGGDDGFRFSVDGGSTWAINQWNDQSYNSSTVNLALSGPTNMVLEYYQNGGADRISFVQSFTTLPVTLTGWSVTALDNNQALLKWSTTNAVNFDHFVIQRSTDGSTFEDVHMVPAANDDAPAQSYSYTDQDNFNGKLYYRLVMVDRDGKTNYSNIASISLQDAQRVRIYPTRVDNGSFFVETSSAIHQAKLELFDMNGRRLQENDWSVLEGRQQVIVAGNGSLPSGAYIVRLSANQSPLAKQIIMIK